MHHYLGKRGRGQYLQLISERHQGWFNVQSSYTFTKEQPDSNYTVTVTAVAGDGTESAQSAGNTFTTLLPAPTVGPVKQTLKNT
ncbi:hypothetical protein [Alicyclobacillus mengziensis]|uniref:Fibronectin type-III domain-containing protein n=1 Tax=Alicyclobacillus mengziensis TaxID=2931921 RepID=A0A9X7Z7M5_9BACL|nr:hypothetical protein [Alicyclobacillus mengziensis]QSO47510.1 hypothetical protein JZ786_00085 [Alicyclobacillus mengziensis]